MTIVLRLPDVIWNFFHRIASALPSPEIVESDRRWVGMADCEGAQSSNC